MQSKKKATRAARNSRWLIVLGAVALAGRVPAQSTETGPRDEPSASAQPASAELAKLPATRRFRDAMVDSGDFNAALNPALEAVAVQASAPDAGYPTDLSVLARIQAELGQFDKSEANFLKAIDVVEKVDGEYALTLVSPYRGLGRSYIKSGHYQDAILALQTAQSISQRSLGLFNVEQSPLLDDITTAYLGLGDTREAQRIQIERLDNAVKRYGANDQRVIPYRYVLADYYQRSRLPVSAREQYAAALKTQESTLGPEHPALLNPLRQLVRIDLLTSQTQVGEAHSRLVSIVQSNPNTDAVERGEALATLGDWAIVANDLDAARDYYRQAWDALSSKPDYDVAAEFAKPEMLDFIAPLSSVDHGEKARLPWGWIEIDFTFDVSAAGRPLNVQVVRREGAQPSDYEPRYSQRLRETHFRPRLVAGEPVAAANVTFTHYYRVFVKKKKSGAEGAGDAG
jgi:tetratricopeptide (TPR) repeat protein